MSFHWLRDRYAQEQLNFFWEKGINKNAYYFTKHHPPAHHQRMLPQFILNTHMVRKLNFLTESNFQNSVCERVRSWANYGLRTFRKFRPWIPPSEITSPDSLTSRGKKLRESSFRPLTDSSFRPCTLQEQTLTGSTLIPLKESSFKTLAESSFRPFTSGGRAMADC